MFCKTGLTKKLPWLFVLAGGVSLLFGITVLFSGESSSNINMLMGMFAGFGFALLVVGIVNLIRNRILPPEKKKQEEIEEKDERNRRITEKACTAASIAIAIFLAAIAFVFVGLGYRLPAYCMIGGIYLELFTILIATRYYRGKL